MGKALLSTKSTYFVTDEFMALTIVNTISTHTGFFPNDTVISARPFRILDIICSIDSLPLETTFIAWGALLFLNAVSVGNSDSEIPPEGIGIGAMTGDGFVDAVL